METEEGEVEIPSLRDPVTHLGSRMPATLAEVLQRRAAYQPQKLAYRFLADGETDEACITYAALDRRARSIGALLERYGNAGDRALLLVPPGLDFIASYFAALYSGIVAVPTYPPYPVRTGRSLTRLLTILQDARPTVGLTSSPILSSLESHIGSFPELRDIRWLSIDDGQEEESRQQWYPAEVRGDDIAFLQYTSGSTLKPRGVMVSHRNLIHNLSCIEQSFGHSAESEGVIWLPPYHDMGLIGGILEPLFCGFPVTLMSPMTFLQRPVRWLEAISRFRGTTSGGPNFAYDLCLRKIRREDCRDLDLSCWQVAFNGAEPIRAETLNEFAAHFAPFGFHREAFMACYGLAEATLMVAGTSNDESPAIRSFQASALERHQVVSDDGLHEEDVRTVVSCGRVTDEMEVKIVHPETLQPRTPGQVGEILVKGPSVAMGYWNKPMETAETFQVFLEPSGMGPFLRTGDLGFLLDGELFITGRIKDLIIVDGLNHYPHDIERSVEESHPGIRPNGCAAISVASGAGEQVVVIAEIDIRYRTDLGEIVKAVKRSVADQHELALHDIKLIRPGGLPRTSSGKVMRYVCRENYSTNRIEEITQS